jgi:UDP-N-acetylmuramoyl-tripeptide--D-alanyl-D-alanine ligase
LPLPGVHHAANAALAAGAALALGIGAEHVQNGLAAMQIMPGRGEALAGLAGSVILNDSYNANPASLAAAISSLCSRYPEHECWLVLGDMAELGTEGEQLHAAAGSAARDAGIQRLFACGVLAAHAAKAFGDGAVSFADRAALQQALPQQLHAGVAVLVKGSRSAGMEQVVDHIVQPAGTEHGGSGQRRREAC